jgi:hypothetical protein
MPSTLDLRMVPDHTSHVVHVGQPFTSHHKVETDPYTRKKSWQPKTDWPSCVLGGLILPPMWHPWSRGERFRPSGYTTTSAYWAHKHRHAIGTFNTCLRGPTHRSLTNTGRGYCLGGASLPHTTLRPFQSVVSAFHVWAPPGLQFNQVLPSKPKFWV